MKSHLNKPIECADGFIMSVQANESAYCVPRMDDAPSYSEVEVGFPSRAEKLLMPYAENADNPCGTVYPWVPVQVVINVCAKHGGVVSGELPAGIVRLSPS